MSMMATTNGDNDDDFVESVAVQQAELPPSTIEEAEREIDKTSKKFGEYFINKEQSELFAMLPLSDKERAVVIKRALFIEKNLCADE